MLSFAHDFFVSRLTVSPCTPTRWTCTWMPSCLTASAYWLNKISQHLGLFCVDCAGLILEVCMLQLSGQFVTWNLYQSHQMCEDDMHFDRIIRPVWIPHAWGGGHWCAARLLQCCGWDTGGPTAYPVLHWDYRLPWLLYLAPHLFGAFLGTCMPGSVFDLNDEMLQKRYEQKRHDWELFMI